MKQDTNELTSTICHHCGENCTDDEKITFQEHTFCCVGCKTVYQLLQEHGLGNYYQLEEKAKPQLKEIPNPDQYACLDHDTIQQRFITFAEGNQIHTQFYLPAIHCTSCLWLLEKLPWLYDGILQAKVNYLRKEVFIVFDASITSLRAIATFLAQLGYPPLITHNQENQPKSYTNKTLLYKIGVTGFCAGNIMLMSFPEYLGHQDIAASWKNLFGWLSFLLCLPVFFWTADHYWKSAWQAIKHKGINIDVPIAIGLIALFSRSIYEIVSQTGAGYFDSLSSLIFFLLIGRWLQEKTFAHISFDHDYKSYFPISITRIAPSADQPESDQETIVPIEELKKGDIILVRNGELIPADAILLTGNAQIDFSFITGESALIRKQVGEQIYAGGRQKGGILRLQLTKEVSQSYLTQLWNAEQFQKNTGPNYKSLTEQLSAKFTVIVLSIAILAGLFWLFNDSSKSLNAFTAVLIVACPCALALNAPFTLGNALRLLAKQGFFVKNTQVIERIPLINHIVFDKTGTITSGNAIRYTGEALTEQDKAAIYAISSCSTHPISKSISRYLEEHQRNLVAEEVQEISGAGISGWVGKQFIQLGKASFVGIQAAEDTHQQSRSFISINGEIKGHFSFEQNIRPQLKASIATLGKRFHLSLLSGDKATERAKFESLFPKNSHCRFEQEPQEKRDYLIELQQQQQQVMMIGDGLNDAGAIKQADVGIAISDDIHQFTPASDVILLAKNIHQLPQLIQYASTSIRVVKVGYIFSFLYNVIGIGFAVQGVLAPVIAAILMSLSSVSVVVLGYLLTSWFGKKIQN
ncbi:MAG: heavy metal translocating P-type ATPase [Flammeovirgaceae bacterium]